MFRFTQEPSSGSYSQCLAKITSFVQQCVEARLHSFLTPALHWGEWSSVALDTLLPEKNASTIWIGGWTGPEPVRTIV